MRTYFLEITDEDYMHVTFRINESQKKLIDQLKKTIDLEYELAERGITIRVQDDINEIIDIA